MQTARSWTPLIEGSRQASVLKVVREISNAVALEPGLRAQRNGRRDVSLVSGAAGIALLQYYLACATNDDDVRASCVELLSEALDSLSESVPAPWLYGGYSGVAWVVSHLQQLGLEEAGEVDLSEIDTLLVRQLGAVPWPHDYDLIQGIVGVGVYGVERLRQGAGEEIVAGAVDRLFEIGERLDEGVAWFHPPWLISPEAAVQHPQGWYNLGLAHGIPGVLALLARAAAFGVRRERALALLAQGTRFLLSQVRSDEWGPWLPYWRDPLRPDDVGGRSRASWCYGAPGAALALLGVAQVLEDDTLATTALDLARASAGAPAAFAGVRDASVCHGSAGLAHQFARLYAASGDAVFADAARGWLGHVLGFRREQEGVAGFRYLMLPSGVEVWTAAAGFLEGAAGIGLALLTLAAPVAPLWDRVLLADAPVDLHAAVAVSAPDAYAAHSPSGLNGQLVREDAA